MASKEVKRTLVQIHNDIMVLVKERKDLVKSKLNDRSQAAIARKANINTQRFNNWLNASSEIEGLELNKISDALNS